jgi:hypothetical protein
MRGVLFPLKVKWFYLIFFKFHKERWKHRVYTALHLSSLEHHYLHLPIL